MIWAGEGAENRKKKREKENTGLVGNCSGGWWERERERESVWERLSSQMCEECSGCCSVQRGGWMHGWVGRVSERAGGRNRRPVESLKPADR